LNIFESMMLDRPGAVSVGIAPVAARLPAQVRRGLYAGNLPIPEGMDERYKASWAKTLDLVRELYKAGIRIEAGTDSLAGFTLHRELELDAAAGIPPAEVLRLATYGAAQIMGMNRDLGAIQAGKLADVVLIDGDPTTRISDVRRTALVIKDGVLYQPAELYKELGVAP
jgi:imidazolonepropionase-like amidohydrolase